MLLNVYNDCAILSEIPTFGDKKKREVVQVLIILVLKVVQNSFPFSIPTELYERLTRL